MPRYLIQSLATGRFLAPSLDDGQTEWVSSLRDAGGGVVFDLDTVHQLVQDCCNGDDVPVLIDLDRLGTIADYMPERGADRAEVAGDAALSDYAPPW